MIRLHGGIGEDGLERAAGFCQALGPLLLEQISVGALRFLAIFAVGGIGRCNCGRRQIGDLADGGAADHGAGFDQERDVVPRRGCVGGDGLQARDGVVVVGLVELGRGLLVGAVLLEPRGCGRGYVGGHLVTASVAIGEDSVLSVDPVGEAGGVVSVSGFAGP